MSGNKRWRSEDIDDFYNTYIKSDYEEGYFPTYKYLLTKGYIGFYIALYHWKTAKYPSIESFCKQNNLKRLTTRKIKWTREYIDIFYETKILPHVKDNRLPPISWFKEKWWEYWGFISILNLWKIEWYLSVLDFKAKHKLETKRKVQLFPLEKLDIFYKEEIKKHVVNNRLPNQRWFQKIDGDKLLWYKAIVNWLGKYKWLKDFSDRNGLSLPSKIVWDKESIDEMFYVNIKPLMEWNTFLSYEKFKELWGKYLNFYNVLRNKRVKEYNWIKDFKKKHKLI